MLILALKFLTINQALVTQDIATGIQSHLLLFW